MSANIGDMGRTALTVLTALVLMAMTVGAAPLSATTPVDILVDDVLGPDVIELQNNSGNNGNGTPPIVLIESSPEPAWLGPSTSNQYEMMYSPGNGSDGNGTPPIVLIESSPEPAWLGPSTSAYHNVMYTSANGSNGNGSDPDDDDDWNDTGDNNGTDPNNNGTDPDPLNQTVFAVSATPSCTMASYAMEPYMLMAVNGSNGNGTGESENNGTQPAEPVVVAVNPTPVPLLTTEIWMKL